MARDDKVDHFVEQRALHRVGMASVVMGGKADETALRVANAGGRREAAGPLHRYLVRRRHRVTVVCSKVPFSQQPVQHPQLLVTQRC